MAKENSSKNRKNTIVGIVVLVLALVGVVSLTTSVVRTISNAFDNSSKIEEYKEFISPVIMSDPTPFDDVINADQSQLLSISIWSLLSDGLDPDDVEYSGTNMLITKELVEKEFVRLFGTDVAPLHQTVDGGDGVQFEYSSKKGKYSIPLTSVDPVFSPMIADVSERGSTVILTVGCLANTDWKQASNGDMIAPDPVKYVKITLRSSGDGYYVSSLKDTDPLEAVSTTQEETEEEKSTTKKNTSKDTTTKTTKKSTKSTTEK